MRDPDSKNHAGMPPNPAHKPGYRLEFQDEFDGKELDSSRWLPFYLPQWSSRKRSAARYWMGNGVLKLLIEADQQPWCPEFDGGVRVSSLQTGCFSGRAGSRQGQHRFHPDLVVTEHQPEQRLFTPLYGYFETRLKAILVPGYMVALWMIGFEDRPERSAEICICEIFGHQALDGALRVGYGLHPFNDPEIQDDFHQEVVEVDAAGYHIYAADWSPGRVTFFVDHVPVRSIEQSPDYPMQLMLGVYEIPAYLQESRGMGPWPRVFEVDYVRGYRPASGYRESQDRL